MELVKKETKPSNLLIKEIEEIENELFVLSKRLNKIKRLLVLLKESQ